MEKLKPTCVIVWDRRHQDTYLYPSANTRGSIERICYERERGINKRKIEHDLFHVYCVLTQVRFDLKVAEGFMHK